VSQLSASGGRVQMNTRGPQREGYSQEGVTGLATLGVRDLTYKVTPPPPPPSSGCTCTLSAVAAMLTYSRARYRATQSRPDRFELTYTSYHFCVSQLRPSPIR
jgi:hypothetical protein